MSTNKHLQLQSSLLFQYTIISHWLSGVGRVINKIVFIHCLSISTYKGVMIDCIKYRSRWVQKDIGYTFQMNWPKIESFHIIRPNLGKVRVRTDADLPYLVIILREWSKSVVVQVDSLYPGGAVESDPASWLQHTVQGSMVGCTAPPGYNESTYTTIGGGVRTTTRMLDTEWLNLRLL